MERIKDYLLMEEEFIQNQERLKPQEEKHEVTQFFIILKNITQPGSARLIYNQVLSVFVILGGKK